MRYFKIGFFVISVAILSAVIFSHTAHSLTVNVLTDKNHYPINCPSGQEVFDTGGGWFACRSVNGGITSGTINAQCNDYNNKIRAQGFQREVDGIKTLVYACYQLLDDNKNPTEIAGNTADVSSSDYWNAVFAAGLTKPSPVTTAQLGTCPEGFARKEETAYEVGRGTYRRYVCRHDSGRTAAIICPEGYQTTDEGTCITPVQVQSQEENTTNEQKTCGNTMEHMGWLFCGIIDLSVGFADAMWGLFEGLLAVEPLGVGNGASSLIGTWSNLRDIVNVLLAIVFVVIVFSQISNIGISNYGIKKMLPRFVIAAVGVNISFFLMQVIIDSSNILGKTTHDFIMSASSIDMSSFNWGDILVEILAASTVVGAGAGVGIAGAVAAIGVVGTTPLLIFLLVLIIPAVIGIVAGVLALGFRMAIIQVLAIISPLALVAWILPNTQKLFDKWSAAFFSLVFMYPLASILLRRREAYGPYAAWQPG